jgi:hypothetical protein
LIGVLAGLVVMAAGLVLLNAVGWVTLGRLAPTTAASPEAVQEETVEIPTQQSAVQAETPVETVSLPAGLDEILVEPVLEQVEEFDRPLDRSVWGSADAVRVDNGIAEVRSEGRDDIGLDARGYPLQGNQGVVVLYSYEEDTHFRFALETEEIFGDMPGNRVMELSYDLDPVIILSGYELNSVDFPLVGNLEFEGERWYYALLAIDQAGEALVVVWDRDDPSRRSLYREALGGEFAGITWVMISNCWDGAFFVDSFFVVSHQGYLEMP